MELRNPGVDLSVPYRILRCFGLSPEQKSCLFKLIQHLLPTKDRLARIGRVNSAACLHCPDTPDSTTHLLKCITRSQVSAPFVACLRTYVPNISTDDIVSLNIPVQESLELPVYWLISSCLGYIWQERVQGKQAVVQVCKAILSSNLAVLRSTKWKHTVLHNSAVLLEDMINLHFNV